MSANRPPSRWPHRSFTSFRMSLAPRAETIAFLVKMLRAGARKRVYRNDPAKRPDRVHADTQNRTYPPLHVLRIT